eukprot:jgi/Bigna1/91271/estExt_fgenesh1_pg.C_950001
MHLKMLPEDYEGFDTKRMMILYLALSGLDVLGALDKHINKKMRERTIKWIYAMQKYSCLPPIPGHFSLMLRALSIMGETPPTAPSEGKNQSNTSKIQSKEQGHYGFRGGSSYGGSFDITNRKAITESLKALQCENGCFKCATSEEDDMRFMYCACAISEMLGDWSGVDKKKAVKYIQESQAFDGGIGLRVGAEGHGGTTYCAIASLVLMGRLKDLPDREALIRWCMYGQGATMKMLGVYDLTACQENRKFNLSCQTTMGGFGKYPDSFPDPLHSYFGICGLSFMGVDECLLPVDPVWGITERAKKRALKLRADATAASN